MAEQRPPSPNYPPSSERPEKDYYEHEKEKEQWEHDRSPRRSLSRSSPRGDEAPNDGDTLHISNLPKDFSEENLKKLFSIYGNVVSVSIPKDPRTSIGRGFGFVRMETSEEAAKSIQGIQTSYPEYSVELSRRSKPRSSTPGQYLGSEKNRRSNKIDMRRYDYDRQYDRRSYREYDDRDRYDRLYRPSSYRNVERNYDRSYGDRYHKSYDRSYSGGYDDYDYHRSSPYSEYPYDDRYPRGYSERDRYYRYGAPYHRPPHDDSHHHHHGSPPHGRD